MSITKISITAISLVLFFVSCATEKSTSSLSLQPIDVVSQLGDSIFLSKQVSCIDTQNGTTYISDYRSGLYALDKDLKLIKKVSTIGNGTNEVNCPAMIYADPNNNVILYNEGLRKFSYFANNFFTKKDSRIIRNNLSDLCRFFSIKDTIYQSIINDKFLVSITVDGKTLKKICPLTNDLDSKNKPAMSERHLVKGDSTFFLIGMALPIIQEYSFSGKEIEQFDMSSIESLTHAYSKNQAETQPNSFYTIIKDAFYKKNRLYLLAANYEGKYKCNTILVLEKRNNRLQHVATYSLKKDIYRTFCINDNSECYAVCANNSTIEIYKLPKD